MQELYTKATILDEEIAYLKECMVNASDTDYWNTEDKFAADIAYLVIDLIDTVEEIENFGGVYDRSQ